MDERIKEHLKHLNKYYLLLLEAQKVPHDVFINDPIYQGSSERFLQLAIESCLNIGNRLIALYQFQRPISTPETYADIFREIQKLGVVDHEFETSLINMAGFRNRFVHLYWEIDIEAIYGFIHENLDDFKRFEQMVVEFLIENRLGE